VSNQNTNNPESALNIYIGTVAPLMMVCIIELGTGLLACSLATLRPLLNTLFDMTASSRSALSNIFSRSRRRDSNGRSVEDNGPMTSRSMNKRKSRDLSALRSETRDLEYGEDRELQIVELKSATTLDIERGRSQGSDVSLVRTK
jgi:hypothetical protein